MANYEDDLESTCSEFSIVSIGGEEVTCEKAVDDGIVDLQQALNNIQSGLREIIMLDFHGEGYEIINPKYVEIEGLIKEGGSIMKDLLSIARQLKPKKPKESKKESKPSFEESCH